MEDIAGIYTRELPTVDRHVQLGIASGTLVHVSFPPAPDEDASTEHELLDRFECVIEDGEPDDFQDVEIGLTVPTDQRAVLERLRTVRPGETVDVRALARMTPSLNPDGDEADDGADDGAEEAIGVVHEALGANPIPVVLPDHRVDNVSGALPGAVRRRLREVEGLSG